MSGRRGNRSSRDAGKSPEDIRLSRISRTLSSTLRHNAVAEGLKMQGDGYVEVADLLLLPKYKSLQLDFATLKKCVDENDKQRYKMIRKPTPNSAASSEIKPPLSDLSTATNPSSSTDPDAQATWSNEPVDDDANPDPANYLIRATQGHSIKLDSAQLLKPITSKDVPPICVHGTFYPALTKIVEAGSLSAMTRTHIHMSSGLPHESIHPTTGETIPAVISGMRFDAEVVLFIDMKTALEDGYTFWRSDNGVILTEGKDGDKKLPLEYVFRAEDVKGGAGGGDLWRRGEGKLKNWPDKGRIVGGGGRGRSGRGGRGGQGRARLNVERETYVVDTIGLSVDD